MAQSGYLGLDAQAGEAYRMERRAAGKAISVDGFVTTVGSVGANVADAPSLRLATDLHDLMEDVVDQKLRGSQEASAFFPRAAELTFERLCNLPGDVLASADYWRFLALHHLYEVIDWRYPADNGDRWGTNPSQFTRSMPLALFVRGQIRSHLDPEGRHLVDSINDVDIWSSHVLAVLYGTSPTLVVEFLRVLEGWQDPKDKTFSDMRRKQLRELARMLTAARSNFVFDLMGSESCRALVEDLSMRIQTASAMTVAAS